jgi:hypothetical protein
MRRIAIVVLLAVLAVLLAAPVAGRSPNKTWAGSASKATGSAKVTVATAEQGGLDIDVTPASGPSTKVVVNYELTDGRVVASTACIGQFNAASGASAWGCGSFPMSALAIARGVSRASLSSVSIPVDRCNAAGVCTAGTAVVTARLTSVRETYDASRNRTATRVGGCKVVTTSVSESSAATGSLTVDGTTYAVQPVSLSAGGPAFPAISRSPTTTRTTC